MIAVLSPAKTLDLQRALPGGGPATRPRMAGDADRIARGAARLGASRIGALMRISPRLAELNAARFRDFPDAAERPALAAFAGDVYAGFDVPSLDAEALGFAQGHLRILSGLYGLLRPRDAIRPYRMEMGTRWAPGRNPDLYAYWGDRIADALAADVAAEGSGTILNLASQEYWHAVEGRLPSGVRVVAVDFREGGPDGTRFVSFHAKRARGAMARWMCDARVTDAEAMRGFDAGGYRFVAADSTADRWTFVRG